MDTDTWVSGYKVRSFPWVDGKTIYFNVQCCLPGRSLSQPPVWDKTVYITDNAAGRNMVANFAHSLTEYIANLEIPAGRKIILTVERSPKI